MEVEEDYQVQSSGSFDHYLSRNPRNPRNRCNFQDLSFYQNFSRNYGHLDTHCDLDPDSDSLSQS